MLPKKSWAASWWKAPNPPWIATLMMFCLRGGVIGVSKKKSRIIRDFNIISF